MKVFEWIEEQWGIHTDLQLKLLFSVVVVLLLWAVRNFALRIVFQRITDPRGRYQWRNGIKNGYLALLIIALSNIWIDRFDSLATFLGLVTAGLTIALQVPILNFVGWIFLVTRKPFVVGDRIEIGDIAGDVIDIQFFQFTLNEIKNWVDAEQSTGRIVHIPNGKVFDQPQANYTQGFSHIWNEIAVLITFESNWRKAKELLEQVIDEQAEKISEEIERDLQTASQKYMIFYGKLTPIVYTAVRDRGVLLTMRYLCNPKQRRGSEQKVWEAVLDAFAQHDDIMFAYPTQRVYFNPKESKEGSKQW